MPCWYPDINTDNMGYDDDCEGLVMNNRISGHHANLLKNERQVLYRCCVSTCPGYPYKASEFPHPCKEGKEVKRCPQCETGAPDTWETGPRGSYYQCPSCHTKYGVEE